MVSLPWKALAALFAITIALSGCTELGSDPAPGTDAEAALATLMDTDGEEVGEVTFHAEEGHVLVSASAEDLSPGFHGFHIHETGECQTSSFTSAGGHHNPDGVDHGAHDGDMPVLLVNADGTGEITFPTDRVTLAELLEGDGTAIVVHEAPDNHANIPDRYTEDGPDEDTLATGDAGPRAACGVVEAGDPSAAPSPGEAQAQADLIDADGDEVGTVTLAERDGKTEVHATVDGLSPGFHGFHLHETGECEPSDFSSAGGHYNPDQSDHGDHAGDMPVLLVDENGTAETLLLTDRFQIEEVAGDEVISTVLPEEATAIIVHEAPDNHANIPERYDEDGPDEDTLATGDAGPRAACGVVQTTGG